MLDKWLAATWMLTNCKNGISSYEVARALSITQKSAWFMLHRIRLALQDENFGKLGGEVEVDETFIGGKARNMHFDKRAGTHYRYWSRGKTPAVGMLERGGKVRVSSVIPNREEVFAFRSQKARDCRVYALYRFAAVLQRPF